MNEINTQIAATQAAPDAGSKIDEPPKITPEIQAEVDRLAKEKAQQIKREEFDELTKKAEEKALYWRKEKARERDEYFRTRGRPPEDQVPSPIKEDGPPKQADFEDYNEYVQALTDYRVEQKLSAWREEEKKRGTQSEFQEKIKTLYQKLDEGYNIYPDFEEIAKDPTVPITAVMRDILAETDHPARLAYYLGKNRAEAVKISQMTPFRAHKEMLRIEAEIMATEPTKQPNKPLPGASNAPPPIKAGGGSDVTGKDPSKMTQKEYEAWAKEKGMRSF